MKPLGDLALGQLVVPEEPVAQNDDLPLPLPEGVSHATEGAGDHNFSVDLLGNVLVRADHVHIREGIAVPIHVDGLVDGDLGGVLLFRAEVHQDLIRYPLPTARRRCILCHFQTDTVVLFRRPI